MTNPLREFASLLVILSIACTGVPSSWAQETPAEPTRTTASVEGRIFGSDRVTPIPAAVVRAVRGDGVQVYSSAPADERGNYTLQHLEPGTYDIVVEVEDGVFLVERTLSITEPKDYALSLATVPAENVEKSVPAVNKPVKGYAWTLEGKGPKAAGFWRTPGGIAVIAGGVVAAALALGGGGNGNKGSSSTP